MKKKEKLFWCLLILVLLYITGSYIYNINIAKCTIPYSDFFRWIIDYSKKIIEGKDFWIFFENDGSQHYQPGVYIISLGILHSFNYNFSILSIGGIFIKIIDCMLIWIIYKVSAQSSKITLGIGSVLIFISMLNFNQWEIVTEPFALASAVRIGALVTLFWMVAYFFTTIDKRKKNENYGCIIFTGLFGDLVIITMCGGYSIAVAFTVLLVSVFAVMGCKKKEIYSMWGIFVTIIVIGMFFYFKLSNLLGNSDGELVLTARNLMMIFSGFMLFWGASVLPSSAGMGDGFIEFYCIIGTVVVIAMLIVFISVFVLNWRKKSAKYIFTMCLIVYSNSLGASIALARSSEYGIAVMGSSRYTVDSALGLVACAFGFSIIFEYIRYKKENLYKCMGFGTILISITLCFILLGTNYKEESRSRDIRKFYDGIEAQIQDIDDCSDEFLSGISGTDAETTRESLRFMQENKLSIYQN